MARDDMARLGAIRVFNSSWFFYLILALPGVWLLNSYYTRGLDTMDMLHPTGEYSVRLMVTAMMIGPLVDIIGRKPWLRWLLRRRRWIGFAAFLYASAHLVFYVVDMGALDEMMAEIDAPGIWTGWAAMALMLFPALTSTDAAMRALKQGWKRAQQFAYPAALFTLLHWGLLEWDWGPALVHLGPLMLINVIRIFVNQRKQI